MVPACLALVSRRRCRLARPRQRAHRQRRQLLARRRRARRLLPPLPAPPAATFDRALAAEARLGHFPCRRCAGAHTASTRRYGSRAGARTHRIDACGAARRTASPRCHRCPTQPSPLVGGALLEQPRIADARDTMPRARTTIIALLLTFIAHHMLEFRTRPRRRARSAHPTRSASR